MNRENRRTSRILTKKYRSLHWKVQHILLSKTKHTTDCNESDETEMSSRHKYNTLHRTVHVVILCCLIENVSDDHVHERDCTKLCDESSLVTNHTTKLTTREPEKLCAPRCHRTWCWCLSCDDLMLVFDTTYHCSSHSTSSDSLPHPLHWFLRILRSCLPSSNHHLPHLQCAGISILWNPKYHTCS